MKARMILVSAAGAMLLASPLAVQAATAKPTATATHTVKVNPCKGLKGKELKECKAKQKPHV